MDPPTSIRKVSKEHPELNQPKTTLTKPLLEALSEDGFIDMELLKEISRECLQRLKIRHDEKKFLGNFSPAQILYAEVDGKIEIEFRESEIEPTLNNDRLSELIWMAPEMFQKDSKPSAASDVFSLGLLIFFILTNGGSPLDIHTTFLKKEFHHKVKINLKLLDALTKNTDTILFVDLLKRIIQKVPDQRGTCEDLIDHVALKSNEERFMIFRYLAKKCFDGDKCINKYLVKMMDKKEVHKEGFLGEASDEWKKYLAEAAKFLQLKPDTKTCSSLIKLFNMKMHFIGFPYKDYEQIDKRFPLLMAAFPNFFPHLYNIYREDLPKVKDGAFKEIFKHFNDAENSLGDGSYGTIVYKGRLGPREIAIKRVLKTVSKVVQRETSIMMKIDRHPNILKYFAKEEDENFIYIGTELCELNLATFVQIKCHNMRQKIAVNSILKQTADGLNHLHQLNIIHRDLKPENILIFNDNEIYSVKLADFGVSKPLNPLTVLSTVNVNVPGTIAWIAPEVEEKEHTKSSDVFSLGCVFHFVIFDGCVLWQELRMSYKDVEEKLEEKLQLLNDQGNNEQFLQMNLLMRMLKLEPELRSSAKKVLSHPLFWADKRCLEFILAIRKKFDVLDPKFARKIKDEHQKVLDETPTVLKLKVALDLDKSVVHNDWIQKLDATLAEEFKRGYDEESVLDLLRAIRNKWMHKEELKDVVKDLFCNFTEGEYLRYFTSRFPRLLVHCYNAVENEAKHLLAEYFHDDASVQSLTAIGSPDITLEGSQLTINCADDITFPEKKVEIDRLVIKNISHLFIEQNKSFTNFLQTNSSNVIQLEFSYGSLKFESMNKILQKFPSLKEVRFNGGEYKASKTNQTIKQTTCNNLVKLEIWSAKNSNVLEAFLECQTMQKLTVDYPEVTLEKILQKCASLENLKVWVGNGYPVNDQHEANSRIHQLKVLTVKLWTKDERIQKRLISSILKQNNLQELYFNSIYSLSQSLRQQLAAHICQLERLTSLQILHEKLLEEVEAFAASFRVANTCLEEFGCELRYFKSLPSSFFAHFTNLRKLVIECNKAEETKVEDLISYMNKSQLTSIWLWLLPPTSFQLFQQLQVDALQVLEIHIKNKPQDKVPVFDILQELLPRHPNITRFEIRFANDYDEPKSLELIPMILETLKKLEWLEVENYPKITRDVLNQIVALETLTSWEINGHKSETFYKN